MPTTKTYKLVGGKAKIQIEDLLGTKPTGGWVYQAPGQGNKNAEGAHYYYKSQTAQGSHKTAGMAGRFTAKIDVQEAGTYSILLRASRDTNNPGDARNDIWIRVDGNTQKVMPHGTPQLTSGGDGFVKFKGASTGWVNAHMFSTPVHGDKNPASTVVLNKGVHTIDFAPRSTGYHIDSFQVIKTGAKAGGPSTSPDPSPAPEPTKPEPKPEPTKPEPKPEPTKPEPKPEASKPEPKPGADDAKHTVKVAIDAKNDDFESHKAGASKDFEFGHDSEKQSVGLRFDGIRIDKAAEIKDAYFVFEAEENSKGAAHFQIEIEKGTSAKTYSKADAPDDRAYLAHDVDWNVETWKKGHTYQSADVSELIKEVIKDGGLDANDALAFRISGDGQRVAHAFESDGHAPELVIHYDLA